MEEIRERVIKVVSEVLEVQAGKVADADKFTNLEKWDSLFNLNVVLGIEKEFGLHFDLQEVILITSINSTIDLINQKSD
jgi:acyl carrier protein